MKKHSLKMISLLLMSLVLISLLAGCGKEAKLEYAYAEPASAGNIEMDNYNGMDLSGMEMYRFSSFTFDTYSDGTYILKTTVGLAYNSIQGNMGGTAMTYFGTYTVEPVSDGADNTEYIYTLSVPTRVIAAKDITYVGSSYVDTDADSEAKVADLLNNGQYYSEITVDREFCTVIDKIMSDAE